MVNVRCLDKRYCKTYDSMGSMKPLDKRYCTIYEAMENVRALLEDFAKYMSQLLMRGVYIYKILQNIPGNNKCGAFG